MSYSDVVKCNYTDYNTAVSESLKSLQEEIEFNKLLDKVIEQSIVTFEEEKIDTFNCDISDYEWHYIEGDGNCLLHAVSKSLENIGINDISYQQLRRDVVYHLRTKKREYQDWFTSQKEFYDYIKNISKDGVYCDGICISALANIYNIKINIYNQTTRRWTLIGEDGPDIFLSYENNNHYSLLTPK
jgi:hypothetical protein